MEQLREELFQLEDKNSIKLTPTVVEGFKANLCQIARGLLLFYSDVLSR